MKPSDHALGASVGFRVALDGILIDDQGISLCFVENTRPSQTLSLAGSARRDYQQWSTIESPNFSPLNSQKCLRAPLRLKKVYSLQ